MKTLITKTDYLSYLACKKNFWLSKNKPELFEDSTLSDYELKIIEEGNIVEVIAGPFKGEKARVQRIDESKEEVTVELFEAMVPIPITVRGDHVSVLERGEK